MQGESSAGGSGLTWNLLEMQIFRLRSRPTESEFPGRDPEICVLKKCTWEHWGMPKFESLGLESLLASNSRNEYLDPISQKLLQWGWTKLKLCPARSAFLQPYIRTFPNQRPTCILVILKCSNIKHWQENWNLFYINSYLRNMRTYPLLFNCDF